MGFSDGLRMAAGVFHSLKKILSSKGLNTSVGDEGGFAPYLKNKEEVFYLIMSAIEKAGYVPGDDVTLALDCAASEFYMEERYDYTVFEGVKTKILPWDEQIDYLADLVNRYPIDSIEEGMAENDWEGWKMLTYRLGNDVQLVGDVLFVTNAGLAVATNCGQIKTGSLSRSERTANYNCLLKLEDELLGNSIYGLPV